MSLQTHAVQLSYAIGHQTLVIFPVGGLHYWTDCNMYWQSLAAIIFPRCILHLNPRIGSPVHDSHSAILLTHQCVSHDLLFKRR